MEFKASTSKASATIVGKGRLCLFLMLSSFSAFLPAIAIGISEYLSDINLAHNSPVNPVAPKIIILYFLLIVPLVLQLVLQQVHDKENN